MYSITLSRHDDLDEFRIAARRLLAAGIAPAEVGWNNVGSDTLFADPVPAEEKILSVPRDFVDLASSVICHRDDQRRPLLYEALWRIDQGERCLMQQSADPLLHRLRRLAAAVKHDQHHMTAFVRFREAHGSEGDFFIAWYEPRHHVLRRAASFFVDRFANMRFSILTPDLTLHWDGHDCQFAPGMKRQDAVSTDAVEEWWRRYYASTFNPARTNTRLMRNHMPRHFWRNLPEMSAVQALVEQAGNKTEQMIGQGKATAACRMEGKPGHAPLGHRAR